MRFQRVEDWLDWQQRLNPRGVELGLDRVQRVAERLGVLPPAPVAIVVGGTNGKGSTVAFLDAILRAAGYRVGSYTSPHLLHYRERIVIGGEPIGDQTLCRAFAQVDEARADEPLTYFEFGTLAALCRFRDAEVDVALLEVGLGGRLDAVNVVDADAAVVTSVGLDHMDWLGNDVDAIAREKAGIYRRDRVGVFAGREAPAGLLSVAAEVGADLRLLGRDYRYDCGDGGTWRWQAHDGGAETGLPRPGLTGAVQIRNAAGAVTVLHALRARLPISASALRRGLGSASLAGRFDLRPGPVGLVLDVAHNTEAAQALAETLDAQPPAGRNLAVVGMLEDKPVARVAQALDGRFAAWFAGGLAVPRGLTGRALAERLSTRIGPVNAYDDVTGALRAAREVARPGDRIVAFGSFHTVEAVLRVSDG